MHISKRDGIETWKSWLIRMIAVLLSLVVCAGVIVALTGLIRWKYIRVFLTALLALSAVRG